MSNSSAPVWTSISAAAAGETTITGNVFLPKTQETFGYDADGNPIGSGNGNGSGDGFQRRTRYIGRQPKLHERLNPRPGDSGYRNPSDPYQ